MAKNGIASDNDKLRVRTIRTLVMHVGRAFYSTQFIVILDQLARHEVLKDEDIASRLGIPAKELGKSLGRLVADGLITVYRQNVSRTGETLGRVTSKGYYYIDPGHFCNVVKWRIAEMRRLIDTKLRNELALQGFVCPQCKKTFQTLDIAHLVRPGGLFCDECDGELVDNMSVQDNSGKEDRMQRFNAQTQWIRDDLRKTEEMTMPKIDIQDWIRKHPPIVTTSADGEMFNDDGLAIAGTGPSVKQEQVYEIEFTNEDSIEMEKAQREKEAEAKRQQNALPAWYTRSTVTGQLTAFGLKNQNHDQGGVPDIQVPMETKSVVDDEDTKNTIEMYYANLEAESRASMASTPADMDLDVSAYDDFGTPSAPNRSLTVPLGGRSWSAGSTKRKREGLDADDDHRGTPKHSRPGSHHSSLASSPPNRSKSWESSGSDTSSGSWNGDIHPKIHAMETGDVTMTSPSKVVDPLVLVNNMPIPLSAVTEEHHDLMTPEEYEKYFEILTNHG